MDACGDDEADCREVSICDQTLYCRPETTTTCGAVPTCASGEEGTNAPCGDAESMCSEVTVCEQTLYCRPTGSVCEAVPSCNPDEAGSTDACGDDEAGCREVTVCGETLYCRALANCEAAPSCADGEEGSMDACGAGEAGCREVTVCGETLYCRVASACQDPGEPNNTPGAGAPLASGCRTMGSLCAGDEDWFVIEVAEGEVFTVSARFFNSQGDVDLTLYADSNGDGVIEPTERIDRSWNAADCEAVSNEGAATTTTYWLKVDAAEAATTQDEYRLSWGVGCGADEPQEPFCQ